MSTEEVGPIERDLLVSLRATVAELESSLERLRHEVRTRRLVVFDDGQRERMVAEVVGDVLEVRVDLPPANPGRRTALLCFTAPADDTLSAGLGAQLWVDGDLVGELGWWQDGAEVRRS
jgi:hypothetical protein